MSNEKDSYYLISSCQSTVPDGTLGHLPVRNTVIVLHASGVRLKVHVIVQKSVEERSYLSSQVLTVPKCDILKKYYFFLFTN